MNLGRRLPVTALATVVLGVLGLSACGTSTPSNERMANDIIETVDGLTDAERECMRARLDENYTGDDLEAINEENKNVDWEAEGATGGEKWQALVADLQGCIGDAGAASDPDDSASDGTAASDETAADGTESAQQTEPTETTEPGRR